MSEDRFVLERSRVDHLFGMVKDGRLQPTEASLYFFLVSKSKVVNGKRLVTISLRDLCKEFGCAQLTAHRYMKRLRERKLLVPSYRVAVPEETTKEFSNIHKAMSFVREKRGTLLKVQYKIN